MGVLCFWTFIAMVCCMLSTFIGAHRGRPGLGFLVGFFFGPLGVLIACVLPMYEAKKPDLSGFTPAWSDDWKRQVVVLSEEDAYRAAERGRRL